MSSPHPRHILVFRTSALGDVAMTIPAIYSVATAYPEVTLHVVTTPFCAQLFVNVPSNVKLHPVKRSDSFLQTVSLLRADSVDAVADLHNVLRSWLVDAAALLSGRRVRMVDKQRLRRKAILAHRITDVRRYTDRYFDVFARLGLPCEPRFTSLFDTPPPLPAGLVKGTERWVGIAPFARYANKTYPPEQMQQVVRLLAAESGVRVFLFGSRGREAEVLDGWAGGEERVHSVAGRFTLTGELALMAHLDVMVSMDSANQHMASLVGTRVVTLWGSTTPVCGFTAYGQRPADSLCLGLSCQPCTTAGSDTCLLGTMACMQGMRLEIVVKKVLGKKREEA